MSWVQPAASFFPPTAALESSDGDTIPGRPSAGTFGEAAVMSGATLSSAMFRIIQSRYTYQRRDISELLFQGKELRIKEVLHALVREGRCYVSSSLNHLLVNETQLL